MCKKLFALFFICVLGAQFSYAQETGNADKKVIYRVTSQSIGCTLKRELTEAYEYVAADNMAGIEKLIAGGGCGIFPVGQQVTLIRHDGLLTRVKIEEENRTAWLFKDHLSLVLGEK